MCHGQKMDYTHILGDGPVVGTYIQYIQFIKIPWHGMDDHEPYIMPSWLVSIYIVVYIYKYIYIYLFIYRRKFRSQTSDNMDR